MSAGSQFDLLRQRRFAPLFWVQFLGAANDNIFKFAFDARLRRGLRSKFEFLVGEPVPAAHVTPELLMERVAGLRGSER